MSGEVDPRDFGVENLPFGIISDAHDERRRPAVAFRDGVIDLDALTEHGVLDVAALHHAETLNAFIGEGHSAWRGVRARLTDLLGEAATPDERAAVRAATLSRDAVTMHLPIAIGDYVDFYSSLHHATNVGRIMRPNSEPLLPNYRHVPIGYHGRSGTVVVSGTDVKRPHGQRKAPDADAPVYAPSAMLDVELEMGWVAGGASTHGTPVPADAVPEHVFGYVLLNDWSARDIQAWEYQPLGPFLAKSFATSISPWIVTLDALEPFRVAEPPRDPEPLPHLRATKHWAYDIELELLLQTQRMRELRQPPARISRTNLRTMYWTVAHQLAHVTSNGASIRPGDLFGTGTISGEEPGTEGSLLELTRRGEQPIGLPSGEVRAFLEDGDTIVIRGRAKNERAQIGFGEVTGTIVS